MVREEVGETHKFCFSTRRVARNTTRTTGRAGEEERRGEQKSGSGLLNKRNAAINIIQVASGGQEDPPEVEQQDKMKEKKCNRSGRNKQRSFSTRNPKEKGERREGTPSKVAGGEWNGGNPDRKEDKD